MTVLFALFFRLVIPLNNKDPIHDFSQGGICEARISILVLLIRPLIENPVDFFDLVVDVPCYSRLFKILHQFTELLEVNFAVFI